MEFLKKNKINIIIALGWLITVCTAVFHHEIWRDEAQAWCIARDCSFFEMLEIARAEGHPPLWYILLFPAAKIPLCAANVCCMQILSLLSVFAAAAYFIFKAPFNPVFKFLTVFSSGLIYYLPVISRNYALIPLFLFITADLYRKRAEHPFRYAAALILLSNTHVLILGLCFILFIFFAIEQAGADIWMHLSPPPRPAPLDGLCRTKGTVYLLGEVSSEGGQQSVNRKKTASIAPAVLILLNFIYLAVFLYPAVFQNHAVVNYIKTAKPFMQALKDFPLLFFEFNFLPDFICITLFYILTSIIAAVLFKHSKKLFIIFLTACGYIFFIYQKIWFNGITGQKAYIFMLVILFCFWIMKIENNKPVLLNFCRFAVYCLFLISFINSFYLISKEILYDFSGSKKIAEYIKTNLNDEKTFCTIGAPFTFTPVSAYLADKKLYSYINKFYFSYYYFNPNAEKKSNDEPDCRYFIVQRDFVLNNNYEIIFSNGDFVLSTREFPEIFQIYRKK